MAVNKDSISRRALGLSRTTNEYAYQGIQHFRDVIYEHQALSKEPYVIFSNIDEQTFMHDFDESGESSHLYSDYFLQSKILVAKMPATRATAQAFMGIHNTIVVRRLMFMNRDHLEDQLQTLGRADVFTPSRIKPPDMSYQPVKLPDGRSNQWPSVVFQCAYSDADGKLANDARWLLNASGGDVETVLTISVWKKSKGITFEKWELISHPTRGDPGKMVPEVVQKVVLSKESDEPVHITGAPLVIGFEKLFLRPADEEKGEGDILIDGQYGIGLDEVDTKYDKWIQDGHIMDWLTHVCRTTQRPLNDTNIRILGDEEE
ncbi:hypothetical protein CNMCM5793_009386 [Aspergillus hiratsukae]|uniref:Uncharacterized protein n=1 Tax=Aspergillus hiratsukae TaxID=1194566 RepID=A0A8H6P924_9EURO|nr:hypothetical protein CNMCM5793_009386 [Aspergillus hiratsukae]KAF7155756.1 hypothetical protein CNMCM6106_007021 [Aspergillus hiratsukae]KAF7155775.1 hypothetical protein CNMCM6106_007040 [Aspergillus hiratsukae]